MKYLSFRVQLLVVVALLLIALQCVNHITISRLTEARVITNANADLRVAATLVKDLINSRAVTTANTAAIAISDQTLKTQLLFSSPADRLTIMEQIRRRIGTDISAFAGPDGGIIVSTSSFFQNSEAIFAYPDLLQQASDSDGGYAFGFAEITDILYLIVVIAIDGRQDGGFLIAAKHASDSFFADIAAKLPRGVHLKLPIVHGNSAAQPANSSKIIKTVSLTAADADSPVPLALYVSVADALAESQPLFESMSQLLAGSLAVAVAMMAIFSNGLTRPLKQLTDVATRAENGDYNYVPSINRRDEIGRLSSAFATMITRIKNREDKLLFQARHDSETGLLNRDTLVYEMDNCDHDSGRTVGVIAMRIDTLYDVNHVFGRNIGLETTNTIAERLTTHTPQNALVAREDETNFIISLLVDNLSELISIAKKIRRVVEKPVRVADSVLSLSAQAAIAIDTQGCSAGNLCQMADAALYRGQNNSDDVIIYDPALDEPSTDLFTLMADVDDALSNGEFQLYLQPKINLKTGLITEAEALIRWFHKERGFIPPDHFIPLAERTGKIRAITQWVLEEAARLVKELRRESINCAIGINLSARDLHDQKLPAQVSRVISNYDLERSDLYFEITESELMQDSDKAIAVLEDLRGKGLSLAVDDFGTGYSSLEYLRRLPVSELKIDRSFVHNLASCESDQVITRAAIDMGHGLGLKVTAEGVEDTKTAALLTEMGCDMAQGYHFAKPLPYDEFINHTANWRREQTTIEDALADVAKAISVR